LESLNGKAWIGPGIPQTQGFIICPQVNDEKIYAISSRKGTRPNIPTTQVKNEVWIYDIGKVFS